MKSCFLDLIDEQSARRELAKVLPGQADPWILNSRTGDPIAYFNIATGKDGILHVSADISGRHCDQDLCALDVLHALQRQLGGSVVDDN
jgi:hypothetical protein